MCHRGMVRFVIIFFLLTGIADSRTATPKDQDRDGLADAFEQVLLQKFAPTFLISAGECDVLPAEFQPGSTEPHLIAKNGTIYGQVFPAGNFIEIHYYHLWSRDCARLGHPLDPEHVSALIRADSPGEPAVAWKAVYWFSSAHQDTVCDASHGAKASLLGAEEHGPSVWISSGKHASFLAQDLCRRGCGEDQCDRTSAMVPAKLINVGETGAPLNGAVWAESKRWALAAKMKTDFTAAALEKLANAESVVPLNSSHPSVQGVIAVSDTTADALANGNQHTQGALAVADKKTDKALATVGSKVGTALRRTCKAVASFLRLKK